MKRSEKLSVEFSRQVASAISQIFPMQESGAFTVRNVEVLSDFSEARVWISRIGGDEDFFERLEKAKNRVAREVYKHIKIVKSPTLVFHEDFTGESAEHMERLIRS